MDAPLRILTWNLFHCRDAGAGEGRAHVPRKLTGEIADVLAATRADVVMLQEVPPLAVPVLARAAGAARAWSVLTGPHVGGVRLRGWLGARWPDLWKTHEGNANVLLMGPRLRPVGPARHLRLNPLREVAAAAWRRRDRDVRELRRWLSEPRRAVAVDAELPGGAVCAFACAHLHGARTAWHRELELAAWPPGWTRPARASCSAATSTPGRGTPRCACCTTPGSAGRRTTRALASTASWCGGW